MAGINTANAAPLERSGARRPSSLASAPADTRSRRATFLKWLRKMHGWIGLWGAALGLLFGVSGILLQRKVELGRGGSSLLRNLQATLLSLPPPPPRAPPPAGAPSGPPPTGS